MSFKQFGAKIGLYFFVRNHFWHFEIKPNWLLNVPRKSIWSWKFHQIFFGIFGNFLCLRIFFPIFFFYLFLGFFQNWPDSVDRMGSIDWIREHLFSRPNLILNLFSSLLPHFPSYFVLPWVIPFVPQIPNSFPSSIPSIFTFITPYSLQIYPKLKPPICSLKP